MKSDMEEKMSDIEPKMVTEMTPKMTPETEEKNTISEKRNSQLAQARVSAAKKRKQRSDDLESIKEQLSSLSSLLSSKQNPAQSEPEVVEEKQQKRIRVTSKTDDEEDLPSSQQNESWMTSLTRFSAVSIFSLGAWYFQNRYGKTNQTQQ